jgi:hypothetical protein
MARGVGFTTQDIRAIPVFIYALTEPSGEIRYVGRSENPLSRLYSHLGKGTAPAIRWWIARLAQLDNRPGLLILHEVDPGTDAAPFELYFIKLHNRAGRLLNVSGTVHRGHCRFCGSTEHYGRAGRHCLAKPVAGKAA